MSEEAAVGSEMDRLASAVAARFAASAGTPRTATAPTTADGSASLVDRLASAVAQRLAARTGANIDLLASAIAGRLAASAKVAPLVATAAAHFSGGPNPSPELEHVASKVAYDLRARTS